MNALEWAGALTGRFETESQEPRMFPQRALNYDAVQKMLTMQMVASNFNSFYF